MASSLRSALTYPPPPLPQRLLSSPKRLPKLPRPAQIRCGPRSNRGPLVKGRTLSTEAILAVQSLKRASRSNSPPPNLARLLKPDLLAALRELLRQDLCHLALHVLSTLRSEYPDHDPDDLLSLYADVVLALSRNRLYGEIDEVVRDLEEGGVRLGSGTERGLVRVVKGLVEAGRKESTVRIVEMMRRCGCGDTWTVEDYTVKTLSRGLKGMGQEELAGQVEGEFGQVLRGSFGKLFVV